MNKHTSFITSSKPVKGNNDIQLAFYKKWHEFIQNMNNKF